MFFNAIDIFHNTAVQLAHQHVPSRQNDFDVLHRQVQAVALTLESDTFSPAISRIDPTLTNSNPMSELVKTKTHPLSPNVFVE